MTDNQDRTAYYRHRAAELRAVSQTTRDPGTRLALLSLAHAYETMAAMRKNARQAFRTGTTAAEQTSAVQ
jgi:hypothetical protein